MAVGMAQKATPSVAGKQRCPRSSRRSPSRTATEPSPEDKTGAATATTTAAASAPAAADATNTDTTTTASTDSAKSQPMPPPRRNSGRTRKVPSRLLSPSPPPPRHSTSQYASAAVRAAAAAKSTAPAQGSTATTNDGGGAGSVDAAGAPPASSSSPSRRSLPASSSSDDLTDADQALGPGKRKRRPSTMNGLPTAITEAMGLTSTSKAPANAATHSDAARSTSPAKASTSPGVAPSVRSRTKSGRKSLSPMPNAESTAVGTATPAAATVSSSNSSVRPSACPNGKAPRKSGGPIKRQPSLPTLVEHQASEQEAYESDGGVGLLDAPASAATKQAKITPTAKPAHDTVDNPSQPSTLLASVFEPPPLLGRSGVLINAPCATSLGCGSNPKLNGAAAPRASGHRGKARSLHVPADSLELGGAHTDAAALARMSAAKAALLASQALAPAAGAAPSIHHSSAEDSEADDEDDFHQAMLDCDEFDAADDAAAAARQHQHRRLDGASERRLWDTSLSDAESTPATTPRSPQSNYDAPEYRKEGAGGAGEAAIHEPVQPGTLKAPPSSPSSKGAREQVPTEGLDARGGATIGRAVADDAVFVHALPPTSRKPGTSAGSLTLSLPYEAVAQRDIHATGAATAVAPGKRELDDNASSPALALAPRPAPPSNFEGQETRRPTAALQLGGAVAEGAAENGVDGGGTLVDVGRVGEEADLLATPGHALLGLDAAVGMPKLAVGGVDDGGGRGGGRRSPSSTPSTRGLDPDGIASPFALGACVTSGAATPSSPAPLQLGAPHPSSSLFWQALRTAAPLDAASGGKPGSVPADEDGAATATAMAVDAEMPVKSEEEAYEDGKTAVELEARAGASFPVRAQPRALERQGNAKAPLSPALGAADHGAAARAVKSERAAEAERTQADAADLDADEESSWLAADCGSVSPGSSASARWERDASSSSSSSLAAGATTTAALEEDLIFGAAAPEATCLSELERAWDDDDDDDDTTAAPVGSHRHHPLLGGGGGATGYGGGGGRGDEEDDEARWVEASLCGGSGGGDQGHLADGRQGSGREDENDDDDDDDDDENDEGAHGGPPAKRRAVSPPSPSRSSSRAWQASTAQPKETTFIKTGFQVDVVAAVTSSVGAEEEDAGDRGPGKTRAQAKAQAAPPRRGVRRSGGRGSGAERERGAEVGGGRMEVDGEAAKATVASGPTSPPPLPSLSLHGRRSSGRHSALAAAKQEEQQQRQQQPPQPQQQVGSTDGVAAVAAE